MIEEGKYRGKKVSVLGAGVSGRALAELSVRLGAQVFVSDAKALKPEAAEEFKKLGVAWEENGNTERLLDADEIVVSSGISPQNPMLVKAFKKVSRSRASWISCTPTLTAPSSQSQAATARRPPLR